MRIYKKELIVKERRGKKEKKKQRKTKRKTKRKRKEKKKARSRTGKSETVSSGVPRKERPKESPVCLPCRSSTCHNAGLLPAPYSPFSVHHLHLPLLSFPVVFPSSVPFVSGNRPPKPSNTGHGKTQKGTNPYSHRSGPCPLYQQSPTSHSRSFPLELACPRRHLHAPTLTYAYAYAPAPTPQLLIGFPGLPRPC